MKKPLKIILIIIAILVVLPFVVLGAYCICMPSGAEVLDVFARTYILYPDAWGIARLEPKEKRIDVTQPTSGLVLEGDGYSITVSGYSSAQLDDGLFLDATVFSLADDKDIILFDKRPMGYVNNESFKDLQSWLELASGMDINSEFVFKLALFTISTNDFTLSDDKKNHALAKSLAFKGPAAVWGCTDMYYIENDRIMAVEMRDNSDLIKLEFCSKDDPDSIYWLTFKGDFTMEEADSIISTIQFE